MHFGDQKHLGPQEAAPGKLAVIIMLSDYLLTVGDYTFEGCFNLRAADLGYECYNVGASAFRGCIALGEVIFNGPVKNIRPHTFGDCISLQRVTLPHATIISSRAFFGCRSLRDVFCPDVKVIYPGAFEGCSSLMSLTLHHDVQEIHPGAFDMCNPGLTFVLGSSTTANLFLELNKYARTATVTHPLNNGDSCVVQHTWAPNTTGEPVTEMVDASGITSPIILKDIGGNEYPVYGCWASPNTNFKELAAKQYPDELGNPSTWAVILPGGETFVNDVNLPEVALMLVRGEVSLATYMLVVVWLPPEDEPLGEEWVVVEPF